MSLQGRSVVALQTFHSPKERKVSFSLCFGYVPNEVADLLFQIGIFIEWTIFHDELNHHGGCFLLTVHKFPSPASHGWFVPSSAPHPLKPWQLELVEGWCSQVAILYCLIAYPEIYEIPMEVRMNMSASKKHFNLWLKLMDLIISHCGIVAPKKHIIDASQPMLFFSWGQGGGAICIYFAI